MNPKEDWLIFENTHEAIMEQETWELAQKLRKTPRRIDTLGEANPLTGLLFCADCGAKMYNQRTRGSVQQALLIPPMPLSAPPINWHIRSMEKTAATLYYH